MTDDTIRRFIARCVRCDKSKVCTYDAVVRPMCAACKANDDQIRETFRKNLPPPNA